MARALLLGSLLISTASHVSAESHRVIGKDDGGFEIRTPCSRKNAGQCGRAVLDDFVSSEEVSALHGIASQGMKGASEDLGPLIMDINTGYVFGSAGLRNIYTAAVGSRISFDEQQYALYRDVVMRVRGAIHSTFDADVLLTAPTFLTRIRGGDTWEPASEHDKYFHYHGACPDTARTTHARHPLRVQLTRTIPPTMTIVGLCI